MSEDSELSELQRRLGFLQHAIGRAQVRAAVVFEGWDASGKGGAIRRLAWALDPRFLKVHPIGAPSGREKREFWLQRFACRLPAAGEIAVFDRSWYGRILVERVEGLCREPEWRRAYDEINAFEASLVADGMRLVKIFIDITAETQLQRFRDRFADSGKRWKLSEEDLRNRARWDDYERAYADMFRLTSTEAAPWTRIDGNDKSKARRRVLAAIAEGISTGIDLSPPEPSEAVLEFFGSLEEREG